MTRTQRLREALAQAVAALDENDKHHRDYDDYGGYPGSVLQKGNEAALNCARDALAEAPEVSTPIDMVLHCPACGMQHIDAHGVGFTKWKSGVWTNPPHRSHLCHGCGHIWRPADVPTNGVTAITTKGKNDSSLTFPPAPAPLVALTEEEIRVAFEAEPPSRRGGSNFTTAIQRALAAKNGFKLKEKE